MIKKNKLHIKHIALLFLLTICFSITPFSLIVMGENDSGIDCQSSSKAYAVYLYNIETDSALFEKNIHKKISPASTVKLMTAMVAFDKIGDISKKVTLTEQMIGDVKSNTMKLNIGENIREHRIALDMTQEVLAKKLCVSSQAVSKWETGKS